MNKYLMNTFSKRRGTALVASLSVLLLAGCIQPADIEEVNKGEVSFGVSASYQSDVMTRSADDEIQTRTVYSGKDENNEDVKATSVTERIDWLSSDDITILCQQAEGNKTANFSITPTGYTDGTAISNATIDPIDHKLYWSSVGVHHFFGLYPSPLMDGAPSGVDIATSGSDGTAATITGTIPATQTVTVSGTELKPDMAYAYMYAAAQASAGDVHLRFKPLVTTLRFTLKSQTSFPSGLTLTKIELTSTQTNGSYLAGDFTATITDDGYNPATGLSVANNANRTNAITINVPSGVQLGSTPLMFTILTLPMDQTKMKLKLSFSDGSTKTLSLKSGGSDITVHACKKCYINDANLPWVYELDAAADVTVPYTGTGSGSETYTVTSYKHISGNGGDGGKIPVQWVATGYSFDGGSTWTDQKPNWLPVFTTEDTPASSNATPYAVEIAPSVRHSTAIDELSNAPAKGSELQPFNLSTWDPRTQQTTSNRRTANCYVINSPGWYWFPMVYGNALQNESAYYRAKPAGADGHYLQRLQNHLGGSMYQWISNMSTFTVNRCGLLWQDSQDLVTNVQFYNHLPGQTHAAGGVKFYVAPETICEGNAVIAIYDQDGKIAWSWHIWVTHHSMEPVSVRGNNFMQVNLGWCDGATITWPARSVKVRFSQPDCPSNLAYVTFNQQAHTQEVYGSGPHWQWGRKDPMIPPLGVQGLASDLQNKIYYDENGVPSQRTPIVKGPLSLGYAIQHPMQMIWLDRDNLPRGTSAGAVYSDWTGNTNAWENNSHYCNLWNFTQIKNCTTAQVSELASLGHAKTAYDPCPVGYTVPAPKELTPLATASWQHYMDDYTGFMPVPQWSLGYIIDGNYWPAAGARLYLSSSQFVDAFGISAVYFSSATRNSHVVYGLHLEQNYQWPETVDGQTVTHTVSGLSVTGIWAKGSARPIRCVPE